MRQSTSRICRYCWTIGEEYGVIYGNPTAADLAKGHDLLANLDMDAHQKVCEKNPNRSMMLMARIRSIFRSERRERKGGLR